MAFIFGTLALGSLVYVLLRPPLSWFPDFISRVDNKAVFDISWIPAPIYVFILFHFSDVMWALALAESVYLIKRNYQLAVIIALVLTVLFEVSQYLGIVRGTGDIWDIVFVAIFLSIYYVIKRKGHSHEKKI